ncbi:MAG: DCC1-like thiol-disulfide oxidoreductase family protein [Gammaproteobacteria bacterium]|nr:DCC1-like thiol-disulfide oxidoreductase family protein [Gammaproteobacteria bacterium]MDH5802358.1 DCC1-like thiol-disulfide oxidoreductase family protein [Gammaproteobacteria bacterium]
MTGIDKIVHAWHTIWFQDKNTLPLEVLRLGLGFLLFFNYVMLSPQDVLILYSNDGLFSRDVVPEIQYLVSFSVFGLLDHPWQVLVFHYVFVLLCFCFFVGWQTSWVKWLVLLGHLSYFNRNELLFYGVDSVMVALLVPLCIAPVGNALSVDRIRQVAKHKIAYGLDQRPALLNSYRGFAGQRLIQLQMAVIYYSSGVSKLRGETWLQGDAPWIAITNNETAFFPLGMFAHQYWMIQLMAYGTILIEIAYPFFIWQHKTRPYVLASALFLHVSIAVLLGMYYFATVMVFGHLAFMRREWYQAAGQWWKRKVSRMEIIYDGACGFCKNSMALFLAFDGLNQIQTRNYRSDPSPLVPQEDLEHALYTVVENKPPLAGFDAYRYVVLRTPGTWWFAPLYYIPIFSRLIGRAVYRWIADHRQQLSAGLFRSRKQTSKLS